MYGMRAQVSCSASPALVDGLQPGSTYTFAVAAVNRVGTGPYSMESAAFTSPGEHDRVGSSIMYQPTSEAVVSAMVSSDGSVRADRSLRHGR